MSNASINPENRFLEPLDVLFLRGNQLFGDAGSYGKAMVPPWPSAAAGALRSQLLAEQGIDLAAFGRSEINHSELGTPQMPGTFKMNHFTLAKKVGESEVETLHPIPADLAVSESSDGLLQARRIQPEKIPRGLLSSSQLPKWPLLAEPCRNKAIGGYWLTFSGWQSYLNGGVPDVKTGFVAVSDLWALEQRVGIGLDETKRSALDGKLFTAQAVAFKPDIGFVASVVGSASLPKRGLVRFGGDGRSVMSHAVNFATPTVDDKQFLDKKQCRLVLTSPGIFQNGWLPDGFDAHADGSFWLSSHGVRGRLTCAVVPRYEIISGWDLALGKPKNALRSAPAGSVYWIEELEATTDSLGKLAEAGLWNNPCDDLNRRAEGFNRFTFAIY